MAERVEIQDRVTGSSFGDVYTARGRDGTASFVELVHRQYASAVDLEVLREAVARTTIAADHPSIPRPKGLVSLHGRAGVVVEPFAGMPLSSLAFGDPVPMAAALGLVQAVAEALDHAWQVARFNEHALRWAHGDLQPGCIFVAADGTLSVTGFGLSEAVANVDDRRLDVEVTAVFNSLAYMAPERIAGGNGDQSDAYALGIMLYEMVTGARLGGTVTAHATREAHDEMIAQRSEGLRATVADDPGVGELIERLTAYDPHRRPSRGAIARECGQLIEAAHGARFEPWAAAVVPAAQDAIAVASGDGDRSVSGLSTTVVTVGPPTVLEGQLDTPPATEERVGFRPVVGLDLPPPKPEQVRAQQIRLLLAGVGVGLLLTFLLAWAVVG